MNSEDIENQELKEQVNYLRRSIERKEETIAELEHERVPYANEYVEELKQENKKLKEVIDKAINYIYDEVKREGFHHYLDDKDIEELLDILKEEE